MGRAGEGVLGTRKEAMVLRADHCGLKHFEVERKEVSWLIICRLKEMFPLAFLK